MTRTDIIQLLIDKIQAKSYLEVGMGPGRNFRQINCPYKVSVDPNPTNNVVPVTHTLTSDDFFIQNQEKFDVIFIDGLHENTQVYKDITNSLKVLNKGGYIICHDINPPSEFVQRYPQPKPNSAWNGDCWKAWVTLRSERDDVYMEVVDTDEGCGIIYKGTQEKIKLDRELNWEYLNSNRNYLLNLITVEQFRIKY